MYFVSDKYILVHDADSLEPVATYSNRVPRYANAIVGTAAGAVALAAPKRLVEFELATGNVRRASDVPAVALGIVDGQVMAVLADGCLVTRMSNWAQAGRFASPQYTARIDATSGCVVALAGERPRPYDAQGVPQAVAWPTSRLIHVGDARGEWHPEVKELPFDALVAGIIARRIVVVGGRDDQTLVASAPTTGQRASWTLETISGRFEGFADNWGFFTSRFPASNPDSVMLSLYVWSSTKDPGGAVPTSMA